MAQSHLRIRKAVSTQIKARLAVAALLTRRATSNMYIWSVVDSNGDCSDSTHFLITSVADDIACRFVGCRVDVTGGSSSVTRLWICCEGGHVYCQPQKGRQCAEATALATYTLCYSLEEADRRRTLRCRSPRISGRPQLRMVQVLQRRTRLDQWHSMLHHLLHRQNRQTTGNRHHQLNILNPHD